MGRPSGVLGAGTNTLPAFACWAGLAPPKLKAPAGLLAAGEGAGLAKTLGAGLPPAPPKLNGFAVFML